MDDNRCRYNDVRVYRANAYSDMPQYLRLLRETVYSGNDIDRDRLELRLAELEVAADNIRLEIDMLRIALRDCSDEWISENGGSRI